MGASASPALAELIMYDLFGYVKAKLDFITSLLKFYVDDTIVLILNNNTPTQHVGHF